MEQVHASQVLLSFDEVRYHKHWIVIGSEVYDVEPYLARHPGGSKVFQPFFHGGNATEAFAEAGHSRGAMRLLSAFRVGRLEDVKSLPVAPEVTGLSKLRKFFTREDRFQVHKFLGIYCLLHFFYRIGRSLAGRGPGGFDGSWWSLATVLPHALLSGSSFIFHVPQERVEGQPMIWQEFRAHNVNFAFRSAIGFVLLWAVEHAKLVGAGASFVRALQVAAVVASVAAGFAAMTMADSITNRLRLNKKQSTTETMPYWDGCSAQTEARFKTFYAYCQIMATAGSTAMVNLMWPFVIMLPIQLASLLMTCVRKGVLSTRGYHYIYFASLCIPFFVGCASESLFPLLMVAGWMLFQTRRKLPRGTTGAKYILWAPVGAARVALAAAAGV